MNLRISKPTLLVCLLLSAACGPLIGADFDGLGPVTAANGTLPVDAGSETDPDAAAGSAANADASKGSSSNTNGDAATARSDDAGPTTCLVPEAPSYPMKPPRARTPGACSAADKAAFAQSNVAAMSPSCVACVQSAPTDPTWGPIVETNPPLANPGPCAIVAGATSQCADAMTELLLCNDATCAQCKVNGGQCPATSDKRCPVHLKAVKDACSQAVTDTCIDLDNIAMVPCQ